MIFWKRKWKEKLCTRQTHEWCLYAVYSQTEKEINQEINKTEGTQIIDDVMTHRVPDTEDMTVMFGSLEILGDVSEKVHVVTILTCTENVPDLVFTDHSLQIQQKCTVRHYL